MKSAKGTVLTVATGMLLGIGAEELLVSNKLRKRVEKNEDEIKKFTEFYQILIQWIHVHNEGRSLADYFVKYGYESIAIYGMKELGEALFEELINHNIQVKYGIDRDAENIYAGIDVYKPDVTLEKVDVVVVTAIHYYDEIEKSLKSKGIKKVVSLEDVVWEA